jgi:hypothetical protein
MNSSGGGARDWAGKMCVCVCVCLSSNTHPYTEDVYLFTRPTTLSFFSVDEHIFYTKVRIDHGHVMYGFRCGSSVFIPHAIL